MDHLEKEIDLIQIDLNYLKNKLNTIKYSYSRYFTNFLNSCDVKDYFLYSFLNYYNNCVLAEDTEMKNSKTIRNGFDYEYNVPTNNRFTVLECPNMTH